MSFTDTDTLRVLSDLQRRMNQALRSAGKSTTAGNFTGRLQEIRRAGDLAERLANQIRMCVGKMPKPRRERAPKSEAQHAWRKSAAVQKKQERELGSIRSSPT